MRVGTRINVSVNQTNNGIIEKYCYSNNAANCTDNHPNQPDGGLYSWGEAMQYSTTPGAQGICPADWHIPTHDEFTTLERAICTSGTCAADFPYDTTTANSFRGTDEGTKLKSGGTSGWEGNFAGDVNGGSSILRDSDGYFWTSSRTGGNPWFRFLYSGSGQVLRDTDPDADAISVRCIKS